MANELDADLMPATRLFRRWRGVPERSGIELAHEHAVK